MEGTYQVNRNSTRSALVEGSGRGVVAHVGLHALGAFADRLGLGDSLSARIPIAGERLPLHDRGKVLVQAMLMLTGGGEACADIERLRAQAALFGSVPSDSDLRPEAATTSCTTLRSKAVIGSSSRRLHLNWHRSQMGWLGDVQTVSTNGTYLLAPVELSSSPRLLIPPARSMTRSWSRDRRRSRRIRISSTVRFSV